MENLTAGVPTVTRAIPIHESPGVRRKVPPDQIDHIRELTDNYRQFRSLRRKIAALQTEMRPLLDDLETELVGEARKSLNLPDIE